MKKHIALLLLVMLVAAFSLAACGQNAEATDVQLRWNKDKKETLTYKVTLADYTSEGSSALFNNYQHDGASYYKDMVISTSYASEVSPYKKDEIVPVSADGTYVVSYEYADSIWTMTAAQTVDVTYNKTDLEVGGDPTKLDCWKELNVKSSDDETVTVTTTTETVVKWSGDELQRPVYSSTKTDGFYFGATNKSAYKNEVTADYKLDENKVVVTTNGKEETHEVKAPTSKFIDANQLLSYIRSFDKGANKFKDGVAVQVYVPSSNTTYTAHFGFTYAQNCILNLNGNANYVKLNSVNCSLGSIAYMQTQNLPDSLAEKGLDSIGDGYGGHTANYTVTRFRVGNFSYQLDLDALTDAEAIVDALTAKAE